MKKCLSLVLSLLLLHTASPTPLANDGPLEKSRKALHASRVKAGIAALGAGPGSRVRVVLHDKTSYHGHIAEITEQYFVLADSKTGATAQIAYPEVKGVKGNNFSTGAKIGIGVGAAAVAIGVALAAGRDRQPEASPCARSAQIGAPCPPGCFCVAQ